MRVAGWSLVAIATAVLTACSIGVRLDPLTVSPPDAKGNVRIESETPPAAQQTLGYVSSLLQGVAGLTGGGWAADLIQIAIVTLLGAGGVEVGRRYGKRQGAKKSTG